MMILSNAPQPLSDHPEDVYPQDGQQKPKEKPDRILLLKSRLAQIWSVRIDIRPKQRAFAILFIAIILAGIPPALVVADRWFQRLYADVERDVWCQLSYSFWTCLPPYFLFVLACIVGLLVIMFFQRRESVVVVENSPIFLENPPVGQGQARVGLYFIIGSSEGFALIVLFSLINHQYPGWSLVLVWLSFLMGCFLRAFTLGTILDFWKRDGDFWISILLAHASVIAILVGYFGQPQFFWATVVLLILALANLWRFRQRVPLIFWIVSLAMIFYSININGWWVAVIGDDYSFHDLAWRLAEKTSFLEMGKVLFKADGVYGTHPYFSSFLQAVPMKFFGHGNFSWRFSSLYLCSLGVGLFYLFCKTFISKHLSLFAAFLLAVSAYIMSFGKIGYNNLQALFALTLVLALTAWALRSRFTLAFACLGSALALCFYIYPAALYVIPVSFFLLALYDPLSTREAAKRWVVMLIVVVAMIYPLMLQPVYWQTKVAGTFYNRTDLFQSFNALLAHFVNNIFYAFFSFLYIPIESHFVVSSYLDPLTSILFLIGFCLLIYQMHRQRFAIFVMLTFVFFLFSVGASHDRETPPNTRMFLFLPLYALIAVWGLAWVGEKIRQIFSVRAGTDLALMSILLVAITGVNLYQAYPLSYARAHYTSIQQIESLFIRVSQNLYEAEPEITKDYVFVINESWNIGGLMKFKIVYPHLAWAQIHQIHVAEPVLPESSLPLLADRNTIVILSPWLDPAWVAALQVPLRALGKEPCEISMPDREEIRFILYHVPDLPQACYP
jgi:hypothetical protein